MELVNQVNFSYTLLGTPGREVSSGSKEVEPKAKRVEDAKRVSRVEDAKRVGGEPEADEVLLY